MGRPPAVARAVIGHEYRDSDGYWIELRPGWIVRDEGTHGLVEDTKRAAYAKLAMVIPCVCAECLQLIASAKPKNPAAVALGKLGGRAKSDAKTAAVRLNAKKGGWPKGRKRGSKKPPPEAV